MSNRVDHSRAVWPSIVSSIRDSPARRIHEREEKVQAAACKVGWTPLRSSSASCFLWTAGGRTCCDRTTHADGGSVHPAAPRDICRTTRRSISLIFHVARALGDTLAAAVTRGAQSTGLLRSPTRRPGHFRRGEGIQGTQRLLGNAKTMMIQLIMVLAQLERKLTAEITYSIMRDRVEWRPWIGGHILGYLLITE